MSKLRKNFYADVLKAFEKFGYTAEEFLSKKDNPIDDGLRCFTLSRQGKTVFVSLTDPKVKGGTFSIPALKYFHEFLDYIETDSNRSPYLCLSCSGGVRLTQSRTMFNHVWGILPRLFKLRKQRLYLSMAHEFCLGAAALFFGQAHFRIASTESTLVNLTGPSVINRFFGKEENFNQYASAGHQIERHLLVQEVCFDLESALERLQQVLLFETGEKFLAFSYSGSLTPEIRGELPPHFNFKKDRFEHFFEMISDQHVELMPNTSGSGQTFLCRKGDKKFGVLINPLDHPVNTISVATIERYTEAIEIFKAMQVPLLSVTDTPGGDPRQRNSDHGVILKTLRLIELLCDYPFSKMGLIAGRCFGGSGLLALPTVHGSKGLYALTTAKMGAMADEMIEAIAKTNAASLEEWTITKNSHKSDLSDMLETGNLQQVIAWEKLPLLMESFLGDKQL